MFKKKAIKKDNLITKEDLGLGSPKAAPAEEEKKEEEVRGILEESKKIKKRSLKGVEANPKRIASPPEEKNQKEMTGLLDKGFLRQTGQVDIMDKNLEKHLNENQLSDTYGGKFTRTKQPLPQTSILKSLEPELGHIFKINELTKTLVDNAKEQTQWVSGMMEVQVGLDRKIKNIEASEAAKTGKQIVEEAPVYRDPRRKDPKTKEQDKEYKKQMKDFEKAFRKEGRKFVKDQMMRKMESSAHEASQLED